MEVGLQPCSVRVRTHVFLRPIPAGTLSLMAGSRVDSAPLPPASQDEYLAVGLAHGLRPRLLECAGHLGFPKAIQKSIRQRIRLHF